MQCLKLTQFVNIQIPFHSLAQKSLSGLTAMLCVSVTFDRHMVPRYLSHSRSVSKQPHMATGDIECE